MAGERAAQMGQGAFTLFWSNSGVAKNSGRTKGELKLPPKSWCAEELSFVRGGEVVTRKGIEIEGGNIPFPKRVGHRGLRDR